MNEASQNAIGNARDILIQSLQSENAVDVESFAFDDAEALKSAINATLASLKRAILAPIQGRLEERNHCLPVNQLPPEVLEIIFQEQLRLTRLGFTKPDRLYIYGAGIYYQAVLSLALVSKRWYRIVSGTPSLWTMVSLAMPKAQIEKAIALSEPHPLDVHCEMDPEEFRNNTAIEASLFKFVELITPHLGRAKLIRAALPPEWLREILPMLSLPNETIETLEIYQYHLSAIVFASPPFSNLFQDHAPKLTHIKIAGIPPDWRTFLRFPALQTLKLRVVQMDALGFDSILRECVTLRTLDLEHVFLLVDVQVPSPPLDVPNLRKLIVKGLVPESPVVNRIRSL